jgi:hypothetical protein
LQGLEAARTDELRPGDLAHWGPGAGPPIVLQQVITDVSVVGQQCSAVRGLMVVSLVGGDLGDQ